MLEEEVLKMVLDDQQLINVDVTLPDFARIAMICTFM
jgi:hypothetical protein